MALNSLGIDIAKDKFDISIKISDKYKHKMFANTSLGFQDLSQWLAEKGLTEIHACMESTGKYGNCLAHYLYQQGYRVSVVNPARIKAFSNSMLNRNKTDKLDATTIARYCEKMEPSEWKPETKERMELKELLGQKESLEQYLIREKNRLADFESKNVRASIEKLLKSVEEEIKHLDKLIQLEIKKNEEIKMQIKLLESIPGIGEKTAIALLVKLPEIKNFNHAKKLEAFVGLNPKQNQSGKYRGATFISRIGNQEIRKALYFPAMTAIKYNPNLAAFIQRLTEKGKSKKEIICAVMRKLIRFVFGVLKSKKMFEVSGRV